MIIFGSILAGGLNLRLLQELICILQEEIENIYSIHFFNYLPSSSSSLLNETLLVILKLKLRWDSA